MAAWMEEQALLTNELRWSLQRIREERGDLLISVKHTLLRFLRPYSDGLRAGQPRNRGIGV
jgi:hypothetical protein